MIVPLSQPDVTKKEFNILKKVMKSNVLSIGPYLENFEDKIAKYIGVKHAIAVNSGTSGLHLLIRAFGISQGDQVITTPFSFVASTNCILYEGATPVFVDICPDTLNIDIDKIEEKINEKTKAILPVDVFGHPLDMARIMDIAKKHNIKVIEDSCEALGSEYDRIKTGSIADGSVFAFYPNKQITTGEGGVIVTNHDYISELCKSMRNQGRGTSNLWLHHERLGYNYRMNEFNAALGCAQIDRLDEILNKRMLVANKYCENLKAVKGIKTPFISPNVTNMSWFVYVIQLEPHINRDNLMKYLIDNGIQCKPYFTPIHLQPYITKLFGFKEGDFPITESVSQSTLALPFFNNIKKKQINYVVESLIKGIEVFSG